MHHSRWPAAAAGSHGFLNRRSWVRVPPAPLSHRQKNPSRDKGFSKEGGKGRTDGLGRLLPIRNKPGRRAESCSRGRKSTDKREGAAREAELFSSLTAQKHCCYSALQLNLKNFSRSDARARCKPVACDHPALHQCTTPCVSRCCGSWPGSMFFAGGSLRRQPPMGRRPVQRRDLDRP